MSALSATTAATAPAVDFVATGTMSPIPAVVGQLGLSDWVAWIAIGTFVAAMVLQWSGAVDPARYVAAAAWSVFGVYWLMLVPYYYGHLQSHSRRCWHSPRCRCVCTPATSSSRAGSRCSCSRRPSRSWADLPAAETIPVVRTC